MNRTEYLKVLEGKLNPLPQEERQSAIAYYNEFFDDAGIENEQAVIASLGNPEQLAESILKESGVISTAGESNKYNNATFTPPPTKGQAINNNNTSRNFWIAVLLIVSFPVWIGFVGGVFGVLVGIIAAALGITLALCVVAVVFFVVGIIKMFMYPLIGVLFIGISLVCFGLLILAVFPLLKIIFKVIASACKGVGSLIASLFRGRGVTA